MPEELKGLAGSLAIGRRERLDTRLLRFQRHSGTLTLTLRKGKQMTRPTPLPGRRVRGSHTGRPIMALLDLLGRRWALRVLWELRDGSSPTFRQLQQRCGGVSSSVLADRLRELGQADLVENAGEGYLLTEQGRTLRESLAPLDDWASGWRPKAGD
ncbi:MULTISPECIES: winged helix-turn-helix transcriptional regulator [unclassified Streptomyces]|uniref:winged helix-turn-helix transcriptional regulator n=2 Tax=unclassified Streptomyces TaxID=2593676 RepID=UPI003700CE38